MENNVIEAILKVFWGGKPRMASDSFTTDGSLTITTLDDEIFLVKEAELEKADDHTDTTYFGYSITTPGGTAGDTTERKYHTTIHPLSLYIVQGGTLTVNVTFPAAPANATRVGIFIRYEIFSKKLVQKHLDEQGVSIKL